MPRSKNLDNCVIYHIRFIEDKEVVYIGSSTNFKQRLNTHKYNCLNPKSPRHHLSVYKFMRENGGYNFFEIVPISSFSVNDEIQLRIREREEQDKYPSIHNKLKSHTTHEETLEYRKKWSQDNKAHHNQLKYDWIERNREQYNEIQRKKYHNKKTEETL